MPWSRIQLPRSYGEASTESSTLAAAARYLYIVRCSGDATTPNNLTMAVEQQEEGGWKLPVGCQPYILI